MWCLCAEQDALSQEVEVGAAEHLAFEGFDAADQRADRARVHPQKRAARVAARVGVA